MSDDAEVTFPTEPPFGPILDGEPIIVYYHYRPNKPAAYLFLALFALSTLLHLFYLFRLRSWYFIPLILGGIAEVFGYYGRAWSNDDPNKLGPWILQNLLLLSAAPLIAATIYMTLGRLVTALGAERHALVSPRWCAKIYVLIDFACLASQIAGTVMPASGDPHLVDISRKVILGGLIAQLVALCFFVFMTWRARRRIARSKVAVLLEDASLAWENHFRALEAVTVLVILRSFVRMVEYAQGENGFVISHEAFIYVFDATPMFLTVTTYVVLHPSRLIRDARRLGMHGGCPLNEGHTELRREELPVRDDAMCRDHWDGREGTAAATRV